MSQLTDIGRCAVCSRDCRSQRDPVLMSGSDVFDCPQCGNFAISDMAQEELKSSGIHRGLLSGWLRRRFDSDGGKRIMLPVKQFRDVAALPMPTFRERTEEYLTAASKRAAMLNQGFKYLEPSLVSTAYCLTQDELEVMTKHLEQEGYLRPMTPGGEIAQLLPKGHMAADELRAKHAASSQGFIAMWFDAQMEDARRRGLEIGIREAGYKPHRVDDAHHVDKIDDRIIADIRLSKFVVADLTGLRAGVYYEAGFAHGQGKLVFYTCREDERDKIHFDVRQFNCIIWKEPADLALQLRDRIEAVLGMGPEQPSKI
jgi:nucleoside 2-deoxyribosyltransferase